MRDDNGSGLINEFCYILEYFTLASEVQSGEQYWKWVRSKPAIPLEVLYLPADSFPRKKFVARVGSGLPGYKP